MKGWMNSKVHRENILDPAFTEIGIGVARNDKGEVYYTQDFGVAVREAMSRRHGGGCAPYGRRRPGGSGGSSAGPGRRRSGRRTPSPTNARR